MAKRIGAVTATSLNVRNEPSTQGAVLGKLSRGEKVEVREQLSGWFKIGYGTGSGYVAADYVTIIDQQPAADYLWEMEEVQAAPLAPPADRQVGPLRSAAEKQVGGTWNRYGGLLQTLGDIIEVDPAAAVAVLCVESGGEGFSPDGRMIIRFENHVFWDQWGKNNPNTFAAHFRYDAAARWKGHLFREKTAAPWASFHGDQGQEWRVLSYARRLDDAAALKSISMGGPQIMGFNCARLGYDTVAEMFERFNADIRHQIIGLFDFLRGHGTTSPMVEALQRRDFYQFATSYNGKGQAATYGGRIESNYNLFLRLRG